MHFRPHLLIFHASAAAASLQYCHESLSAPAVNLCVAVEPWKNETTSQTDLLVALGYQRYTDDAGWAAFGLGSDMVGALMFIAYAAEGVPVLSQRRARGHFEPEVIAASDMSGLSISRIGINETNWFEASFTCYGCGDGEGDDDDDQHLQPMIWAANPDDEIGSASDDAHLQLHQMTGQFVFNLDQASASSSSSSSSAQGQQRPAEGLSIDFSLPNGNIEEKDEHEPTTGGHSHSHSPHSHGHSHGPLIPLHGFLMGLVFTVLYPCGAIALRNGSSKAFKWHVGFQIAASCVCAVGALIAGISLGSDLWSHLGSPHVLLGLVLVALVVTQIVLGWQHHRGFKRKQPTPKTTLGHVFIGRFLVLGGCVNVLLGLYLAGASTLDKVLVATIALVDVVVILALTYVRSQKTVSLGAAANNTVQDGEEEDAVPFLDKSGA